MRLPSQKKILREDLKGAPSWINPLIDVINSFMETVYQTLNKNVDDKNLAQQIKELTYTTPAAYPAMDNVEFLSTLKTKAVSCEIMQIYEKSTYLPVASSNPAWVEDNGSIILGPILGLSANKTYIVRLRLT